MRTPSFSFVSDTPPELQAKSPVASDLLAGCHVLWSTYAVHTVAVQGTCFWRFGPRTLQFPYPPLLLITGTSHPLQDRPVQTKQYPEKQP